MIIPIFIPNVEGSKRFSLFPSPDCPADPAESPVGPETPSLADKLMVIFASALLVLALLISFLSYVSAKNSLIVPSHCLIFIFYAFVTDPHLFPI